jgi:hypothetical protein
LCLLERNHQEVEVPGDLFEDASVASTFRDYFSGL